MKETERVRRVERKSFREDAEGLFLLSFPIMLSWVAAFSRETERRISEARSPNFNFK